MEYWFSQKNIQRNDVQDGETSEEVIVITDFVYHELNYCQTIEN
jgi:hypothetical protein